MHGYLSRANRIIEERVKVLATSKRPANRTISFQGWKVMSAVCSTVQDAGALQTVLSRSGNTYTCKCVKPSIYSDFKALFTDSTKKSYSVKCKIIYWECPELT
jgi:hypothetical protein